MNKIKAKAKAEVKHGTYGGYQAHRKRGEAACDDCRAALTAYARAYRAANLEARAAELTRNAAYRRALTRLRARHEAEYQRLYREELGR